MKYILKTPKFFCLNKKFKKKNKKLFNKTEKFKLYTVKKEQQKETCFISAPNI